MEIAESSQSSRWMTKRYIIALTVIALLAGLAYTALSMVIAQQESTGAVVNISGRQRMLSQRTALFVQRLLLARTPAQYEHFSVELTKATNLLERSHQGLTQGDATLGLPSEMSDTVRAMYFGGDDPLNTQMKTYIAALREVLAADFGSLRPDQPEVEYILSTAPGPLLIALDRMVWQYQREGEAVIRMLHRLEGGVLALTLVTLMLEALLIFRPMVRQVGAQLQHILTISDTLRHEVSERKRAEESLQKAHDELEKRVIDRTAALTEEIRQREKAQEELHAALMELERSNSDLQQFAYAASHDLREPLRMVSSYLKLLERRYKEKLDKDAQDYIDYAVDGAKRMNGLIQDLLLFSRVETQGKEPVAIDTSTILEEVRRNLTPQLDETKGTLETEDLPPIKADPSQVLLLFQNLVSNGLKFSAPGVPPLVKVSGTAKEGGVTFCVSDAGIGIAPEYQDRIFNIFQRLHTIEDYPGTGIGLAVCKRIVERHGGRIWVESEKGNGARFLFTLPDASGAASPQRKAGSADAEGSGRHEKT